jgi:hypothetical protein
MDNYQLRTSCCSKLDRPEAKLVFAEVTRNRMTRQIEDTTWLKFVNTTNRNRKIDWPFYFCLCLDILFGKLQRSQAGKVGGGGGGWRIQ